MLKIVDNDIRYKADSFVFNVAGAPEEVKQFSGISRPGILGDAGSNAQLGSEVKIEYAQPLPEKFDLVDHRPGLWSERRKPIPSRCACGRQRADAHVGKRRHHHHAAF
jgi:phosphoglycerol transferase